MELVEENRVIRREIVEMMRENWEVLREVRLNTHLISGLTDNLSQEIEDRVSTVLHVV